MFVSIQEDDGSAVPADVQARINDSLATWSNDFAAEGLSFIIVPAGTPAADIQIHFASTSAVGGKADGVLGCTTSDGTVTLITGWNWYTGSDPTQIGANQFDLQTIVTHELGHVLGLGHSTDTGSVMYPNLSAGVARRDLTANDMVTLGADSSSAPEPLMALLEPAFVGNGHTAIAAQGHSQAGQGLPAVIPVRAPDSAPERETIVRPAIEDLPAAFATVPQPSSTGIEHAPVSGWFGTMLVFDQSGGTVLHRPFKWESNTDARAGRTDQVTTTGAGSFYIQPGGSPDSLVRYASTSADLQEHLARDWFFGAAGATERKQVETQADPFAEDWTGDMLSAPAGHGAMLLAGIFAGATLAELSRVLCDEEKAGAKGSPVLRRRRTPSR